MGIGIPPEYSDKLIKMIENDSPAVHLYQSVKDKRLVSLCGDLLPEQPVESFAMLRDTGIVEPSSLPVFDVFCGSVETRTYEGSAENSLSTEFSMRLSKDAPYQMCSVNALFLRDERGMVTDIHYRICPFGAKETFARSVVNMFSSDKNPELFSQRCRSVIDNNPDKGIAFIQFDVERFKLINEYHSVQTGDEMLAFFNDSLGLICSEDQPFCRLTADVFMIVTPFEEESELLDFIHKLEAMLSGFGGIDYRLIFGVSIIDDRTAHTRHHGDRAALARQSVKGNALKNIAFYRSDMDAKLRKTKEIEDDMQNALLSGEFIMYLQPKYSISTGRIIGAEALARWLHPEKGMIPPSEFIPVFERNGFILKLDLHIWELACRKIRGWIDSGMEPVPISVNISREYIRTFDVVSAFTGLIRKYDIPISLLELEITETTDELGVEDIVKDLKAAGFTMLMDDFGSGYSSLNMLKTTPFDVLKIDKSFLGEFMETDRGRKIIEHTILMSKDIGLGIIAEGVETKEQAQFLSQCGCDSAQGFYYSKPIPEDEFDRRLIEINK